MKVYVASSWRNCLQQGVVAALRAAGLEVYDFRSPELGVDGFRWNEVGLSPAEQHDCPPRRLREAINHSRANLGFAHDFSAMQGADCCVLVVPCGRSAHLEAGWFAGRGKPVWVLALEPCEPELMYRLAHGVLTSMDELFDAVGVPRAA